MGSLGNNSNAFGLKFGSDHSIDSSMLSGGATGNASVPHNYDAAEAAVAKLGSIMQGSTTSLKRMPDTPPSAELGGQVQDSCKKKKPLSNERREERNLREKERSLKITQQIHELRNLLSMGGVIVPKGTKSTILSEVGNYIRLLQQQQYRSEMDKAQLVQEVQRIGNGAIGDKAAYAIRHAAAQNGVSSMANLPEGQTPTADPQPSAAGISGALADTLRDQEYRCVFDSCSVGMAIATMGGSFIDCNLAFTELSSYTKPELKAMTIFNITSRDDLQGAFDMMSHLITPPTGGLDADGNSTEDSRPPAPVILRSAIRHRSDLGLSVSLIRGEDGIARFFNVTLVKLPPTSMGLGAGKPVPATTETAPTDAAGQRRSAIPHATIPMPTQSEGVHKQNIYPGMNAPQYTSG